MNKLNKVLLLVLPLCCVSCVMSKRPLSDETTSAVDQAMIGEWIQVTESNQVNVSHLAIGRLSGSANGMEWINTNIRKDGTVEVSHMKAFTRPGTIRFLSVQFPDNESKEPVFLVGKYDMPDKETFRWFLPSREFIGRAIERGELQGKVDYRKDSAKKSGEPGADESRPIDSVMLDDTPERLVAFLEKYDGQCYELKPVVYTKSMIALRKLFKDESAR